MDAMELPAQRCLASLIFAPLQGFLHAPVLD